MRLETEQKHQLAARASLVHERLAEGADLPGWLDTFEAVLAAGAQAASTEAARAGASLDAGPGRRGAFPFEEVLLPFVAVGEHQLAARAPAARRLLSQGCRHTLRRSLLGRLARLAGPTLQQRFSVYRSLRRSSLDRCLERLAPSPSVELYDGFVTSLRGGALRDLLLDYPSLARHTAQVVDRWVAATVEFVERLERDLPEIGGRFGGAGPTPMVVDLEASVSDLHGAGRSAHILRLGGGQRVVYKPSDGRLQQAYNDLLIWLAREGAPFDFRVLQVLARPDCHWVEYAEPAPCVDAAQQHRYHLRAGALLCLAHVLGSSDLHRDNLVACGEHPVLVDVETLLSPTGRDPLPVALTAAQQRVRWQRNHSVLVSGLLPNWQGGADGRAFDVSGLGQIDGSQETPYAVTRWRDANTDRVQLEYTYAAAAPNPNAPRQGGNEYPGARARQLVAGFSRMYDYLLHRRQRLLSRHGPLARFADQQVRVVFRDTAYYGAILDGLNEPHRLRHGALQSAVLDQVGRDDLAGGRLEARPLVRQEVASLAALDVPHFTVSASSCDLSTAAGETWADCFETSAYERMIALVRGLGEPDRARQLGLIRASFALQDGAAAHGLTGQSGNRAAGAADPHTDPDPLTSARAVDEAVTIADELLRAAVRGADGSLAWLAPVMRLPSGRARLEPMGHDLYDGCTGVALFLAALARVVESAAYRDASLRVLEPVRRCLGAQGGRHFLALSGIGGVAGIGSLVYGLVRAADWLDAADLLDDARTAARLVDAACVAQDRAFDVMHGAAGAILGLLSLHAACGAADGLDAAVTCGRHLLGGGRVERGQRTWPTPGGAPLTGFSHGAAGIAYALQRLAAATGEAAFRRAAEEAIAYEDGQFCAPAGNWPDRRDAAAAGAAEGTVPAGTEESSFLAAWCHGAAGIGLARLGGVDAGGPARDHDIDAATRAVLAWGARGPDHLCCGTAGRIELLLEAGRRAGRAYLQGEAQILAARVVARRRRRGHYALHLDPGAGMVAPGLFTGIAGIGYALLRVAHADRLPCIAQLA